MGQAACFIFQLHGNYYLGEKLSNLLPLIDYTFELEVTRSKPTQQLPELCLIYWTFLFLAVIWSENFINVVQTKFKLYRQSDATMITFVVMCQLDINKFVLHAQNCVYCNPRSRNCLDFVTDPTWVFGTDNYFGMLAKCIFAILKINQKNAFV